LSLPIFLSPAIFSCHRYFVAVNILSPSIFCRHRYFVAIKIFVIFVIQSLCFVCMIIIINFCLNSLGFDR
jgi:hypothetical protein